MSTAQPPTLNRGIVKSVLSGDAIVIRGQPRGGPPPERTLCFSNITAPRLARRANPNDPAAVATKDEPFAWEAREFLRKKLIGKEVFFTVEYKIPSATREYGVVFLPRDGSAENRENLTESLLSEGLVELRRMGLRTENLETQKLIAMEETARASGIGKWNPDTVNNSDKFIRDTKWTIDNPRQFVESFHQKPIDAVIEHVRDGCTVRAFLVPSFNYVTVMMSGIKCPMYKQNEEGKQVPEPFTEEAKFFTESRLLQREVKIIMEGVSNQNILGSVIHPNGNIAELLLKEGFARCVDWSMGVVSQGTEVLRAAEKGAKEKQMRIWKDYKSAAPAMTIKDKSLSGKVVECVNGDALVVKLADKQYKKIFLSSIRPPRQQQPTENTENEAPGKKVESNRRSKPLYDVPYMFEAREFMRKKLIGKKISIEIDYIQPPNQGFPEKTCCTVTIGGINVAEALVSKGLATVIRYRQDDDQRSAHYDTLLAAEARAQKKGAGVHSKKEVPIHRVADIAGDVPKAKQFLPFLQRAGRCEAVVEFVASGSRVRLFIPRETCLLTFLISGISCPRGSRPGPAGTTIPSEPFGEDATFFTKEMCLQREVEVEVEAIDKGGNFIGWLFVDGVNLSVGLVEDGLAKVHFTAERSTHYASLQRAEEQAKNKKLNVWANYEEPKEEELKVEEPVERTVSYKNVYVTEVGDDLHFYAQTVENGPKLEKLMEELRTSFENDPPLGGAYTPRRGEICTARFSADNQWYRAKIEKLEGSKISVFFIDYGNREVTEMTKLAALPAAFASLSPQATQYCLACVLLPADEDAKFDANEALYSEVMNRPLLLNVEFRVGTMEYVTLMDAESKEDIAKGLVSNGIILAEQRKEKRLAKLVSEYIKAQDKAKGSRLNLWRYGDFTEDDAKEFGYKR